MSRCGNNIYDAVAEVEGCGQRLVRICDSRGEMERRMERFLFVFELRCGPRDAEWPWIGISSSRKNPLPPMWSKCFSVLTTRRRVQGARGFGVTMDGRGGGALAPVSTISVSSSPTINPALTTHGNW